MKQAIDVLKLTDPKQVEYYLNYYIMIDEVLHKRGIHNPRHQQDTERIKKHLDYLKKNNPN